LEPWLAGDIALVPPQLDPVAMFNHDFPANVGDANVAIVIMKIRDMKLTRIEDGKSQLQLQ